MWKILQQNQVYDMLLQLANLQLENKLKQGKALDLE